MPTLANETRVADAYVEIALFERRRFMLDPSCLEVETFRVLFNHYLLASFLYYKADIPFFPDELYDEICNQLLRRKALLKDDKIYHKHLFDEEALRAGTGYQIETPEYPKVIAETADILIATDRGSYTSVELGPRRRRRKRVLPSTPPPPKTVKKKRRRKTLKPS